jgi:D-alanine-D-alanine ligase
MSHEVRHVALLFGGKSAEHDVSILSARSVRDAAPKDRLRITPICVAKDGRFLPPEESIAVLDGEGDSSRGRDDFSFESWIRSSSVDIVFPLIHGTFGEDGTMQGYLEILDVPYVGAGVTGSATGMDKWMMKYAFSYAKLPMVEYVQIGEWEWHNERERITRTIRNTIRLPYFVKPANAGSSVGVSKVKSESQLEEAVTKALRFDDKVLVERGVDAREIEVSVLGNDDPRASVAGEIVTGREFYDYEDKYVDDKSTLVIPAKIPADKMDELRKMAITAFKAVGASGFARVDFFVERGTNRIYINEINTIPGFTKISMYPKLWEATELKYGKLIEQLVELGLERHAKRKRRFEDTMRFFESVAKLK